MISACKCSEVVPSHVDANVTVRVIVGPIAAMLAALVGVIGVAKLFPSVPPVPAKAKTHAHVVKKLEIVPVESALEKNAQEKKEKETRSYPLIPDEKGIHE